MQSYSECSNEQHDSKRLCDLTCDELEADHANNNDINIVIQPTTGGRLDLKISLKETVANLRKAIAKELKISKEKIVLLFRNRHLKQGTLRECSLSDGSHVTLLPYIETGLTAPRPEQTVMQALEHLSDSQINDFLTGKAPLNLNMRFGDHIMLIQLQLSAVHRVRKPVESSQISLDDVCISTVHEGSKLQPLLDMRALLEASRNLTQTLGILSSKIFSGGTFGPPTVRTSSQMPFTLQCIFDKMHHHGKGVYTGNFSGTLNPALQDEKGQPRKNIGTIIHILHDLLSVTPSQYTSQPDLTSLYPDPPTPSRPCPSLDSRLRENRDTRRKMEQLRLIMSERRARRNARRQGNTPYSGRCSSFSSSPDLSSSDSFELTAEPILV